MSLNPNDRAPASIVLLADDLGAHLGERRVARHSQDLEQRAAAHSPPKFWIGAPSGGLYALSCGKTGLSGVTLPVSSPVDPVTTLNVEPGRTAPATSGRAAADPGSASSNFLAACVAAPSWLDEQVRVVRREAPQREDRSVARVDRDDRALAVAEEVARRLLQVLAHRQRDVAGVVAVDEQVAERLVLLRHGLPAQLVVVLLLDAGGPEADVEVAGDVAEQVAFGILALEGERIARRGRHRLGQHRAVARR